MPYGYSNQEVEQIVNQISLPEYKLHIDSGNVVYYSINQLPSDYGSWEIIEEALQIWGNHTGLVFQQYEESLGDIRYITFMDGGHASVGRELDSSTGEMTGGPILYFPSTSEDEYQSRLATAIHEIGHALGLDHAGSYNGGAPKSSDILFDHDSNQLSVMSYLNADDTEFMDYLALIGAIKEDFMNGEFVLRFISNWSVQGTDFLALNPMLCDYLAIREMYGLQTQLNTSDDVYSFTDAVGGYSIIDHGGSDTIDQGHDDTDTIIDLSLETGSSILGGHNNLFIIPGTKIEKVITGNGNDVLTGDQSDQTFSPGTGWNVLDGNGGEDTLLYTAADLNLAVGNKNGVLFSERFQSDYFPNIFFDPENATDFEQLSNIEFIKTGDSSDNVFLTELGAWSIDANGNELLTKIKTEGGDDRVQGSIVSDEIYGGEGNDYIFGFEDLGVDFMGEPDEGDYDGDTMYGEEGNDFIFGYNGGDTLSGGADNDIIRGNWGSDTIDGGAGSDAIEGGYHEDTITGGDGNDFLWGFEASQSVVAMHASTDAAKFKKIGALGYGENPWESNANEIDGGNGNDYLIGSGGDDTLTGGVGDDVIFGEYGRDTMTGGSGSDVFVFHGSWAYTVGVNGDDDTITDFVSGEDQILLSRPEIPNSDPTSPYYQDPEDPYYSGFAWEFEASRIVFTYQEVFWNEDGEKEWMDREGAALHVNGGYDMSDIHYVDDFAFA